MTIEQVTTGPFRFPGRGKDGPKFKEGHLQWDEVFLPKMVAESSPVVELKDLFPGRRYQARFMRGTKQGVCS